MEDEMKELQDQKDLIVSEVERVVRAEYDVARLRVIDNTSRVVGALLQIICLIFVVFAILTLCAAAAVFALGQCVPIWAACLIIGAVYLLLIPLLLVCGTALFVDPIVRKLSGLKNSDELRLERVRAEGRAAVHRERMSSHVRFAQTLYNYYTHLAQTAWRTVRDIFMKK